jgi:NAD(P)H dehydrogenase (quinone)
MAKVLVLYYSSYGHVEKLAHEIAAGAREAGASADVKRVPELLSPEAAKVANYKLDQTAPVARIDDLAENDAIVVGTGNAVRQEVVPKWQASSTRLAAYVRREPSRAR